MPPSFLENLNPAQHQAVTQAEGPMLIIAGAGTGKTKVITSRILYLLLEKKIPAGQILALTFTEKATEEMIERVDMAMPLSYEEVTIKTFHGFCDQILREKGLEIGIDPNFQLLNQTQQWLFLRKHLFELELDYYRPLGNPFKFLFVLLNHFSRLKDEDILPEAYVAHAEKMLEQASTDEEKETAKKTLEIAKAYRSYQALAAKEGVMDFGDLQYYVLRLLEKRPSVLKELQERYRYILVDEFQDTNFAQNKLLMLLADRYKNLTVVGDDDQAIYKWRGASLSNILDFKKNFPTAAQVVLTSNYRSSQPILDASYRVIRHNDPYRLEAQQQIEKKLKAEKDHAKQVEVWHCGSYLEEARQIAQTIIDMVKKNECRFQDIALLFRTNQQAYPFLEMFKDFNIPFSVRDTRGLFHFEEIKNLIALLRFLRKPHDDVAFFRLLCLPVFKLPMREILDLFQRAKKADYQPAFYYLSKVVREGNAQGKLPGMESEADNWLNRFKEVYHLFDRLLDFSKNHSASRTIGEFLDTSGYYLFLTADETFQQADMIQHIGQFLEMAKDFENEENEQSVRAFSEYLELLEQAQEVIPVLNLPESDAVSVLTVHGSKGLEFEYVFLPSLVNHRFPTIDKKEPLEIPQALITEELPQENTHLQEERRLFYVACTRARKQLFLSYSDLYEGRKKWKPSPFIEEMRGGDIRYVDFTHQSADILSLPTNEPTERESEVSKIRETSLESKVLFIPEINVNQLSYSKIDTFKTCPLKYKLRYLFALPSPTPHAANFGSSVHNTVNLFYQEVGKGVSPSRELLHKLYESCWIGTGYESKGHEQARKKKGLETMEKFFEEERKRSFAVPAFLEKMFRLKIGNVVLSGRIDRIDRLPDGSFEVIDYKTGTYKKEENVDKDLQLSLYGLVCRDFLRIPVSRLSLYFLEDGKKVSTTRTDEDLTKLKEELLKTVEEMKTSGFLPTPGHHCRFCEYRVLCHAAD